MENAWLLLYLFTRLDAISWAVGLGFLMVSLGTIAFWIGSLTCWAHYEDMKDAVDEDLEEAKRWFARIKKTLARLWVALIALHLFVPDQKDMALVVGGHIATQAVVSEEMNETASKLYQLVQRELDEALAEESNE